jgi:hypothetical protein
LSIDEERELRLRLGNALDEVAPSPAPVAVTLRKGKAIRTRRRVGVVAGLAAAVGIALAAPGLVHQIVRPEPITPPKWVLTLNPPGPHSPKPEIAWGTINGKRWEIGISLSNGQECQMIDGQDYGCGAPGSLSEGIQGPVLLSQFATDNSVVYFYGYVRPDVGRVVITLADGTKLTLHPRPLYGGRWVAFAIPSKLPIVTATAYSPRGSELVYAVPLGDDFENWLRPGQQVPRRAVYMIASERVGSIAWSDVVHVGPWGYCSVVAQSSTTATACLPPRPGLITGNSYAFSTGGGNGWIVEGEASPAVGYVVGTLSDGTTVRAQAVDVGGPRLWAWVVPLGQRLRRVVFYSASGRQVAAQSGANYNHGL